MAKFDSTPESEINEVCDINSILFHLWERSSDSLSRSELEWFSQASDYAEHAAAQLETVVEGIGCLIGSDTEENGRIPSGNFRTTSDVPALLFAISHSIAHIRGLIDIGNWASDRLIHPRIEQGTVERSKNQ